MFDSYGQKSNHRFLLNYGFSLEENMEPGGCPNIVPITLVIKEDDPVFQDKMHFWLLDDESEEEEDDEDDNDDEDEEEEEDADHPLVPEEEEHALIGDFQEVPDDETNSIVETATEASSDDDLDGDITTDGETVSDRADDVDTLEDDDVDTMEDEDVDTLEDEDEGDTSQEEDEDDDDEPYPVDYTEDDRTKTIRVSASDDDETELLFSLLRTVVCTEIELKGMKGQLDDDHTQYGHSEEVFWPISMRNERAAMIKLIEVTSDALSMYSTTLDQDIEDLRDMESYPLFSNHRNAKLQVRAEKEVLEHFALWGKTSLDVLNIIEMEKQGLETEQDYNDTIADLQNAELHYTIVRYCEDSLGTLRTDEEDDKYHEEHRRSTIGNLTNLTIKVEEDSCEFLP